MDEQENHREKKKKVNQRSCRMENHKRTNPREKQKKRERKKDESHR
jgi:hypothetical protein